MSILTPWPIKPYPKNPPPPLARAFDWDDAEEDKHEPELDDDGEPGICPTCNGSGEGMYDGSTCRDCGGIGEL